jgi:hypothetical protein
MVVAMIKVLRMIRPIPSKLLHRSQEQARCHWTGPAILDFMAILFMQLSMVYLLDCIQSIANLTDSSLMDLSCIHSRV